jgi:hypothetical protein
MEMIEYELKTLKMIASLAIGRAMPCTALKVNPAEAVCCLGDFITWIGSPEPRFRLNDDAGPMHEPGAPTVCGVRLRNRYV